MTKRVRNDMEHRNNLGYINGMRCKSRIRYRNDTNTEYEDRILYYVSLFGISYIFLVTF